MRNIITLTVCLTITAMLHAQSIIFVKSDGSGDGTSWASACNLETAISVVERSRNDLATDPGASAPFSDQVSEIWVQSGTYYPTKMLVIPASVKVYGGFAGTETALLQRDLLAYPTIIDGQQKIGSIFRLESAAEINGFTVQNGNASGNPHRSGGGVWADDSAIIQNCKIINNTAMHNGGGVYANGKIKIINCNIQDNFTQANGANTYGNCLIILTDEIPACAAAPTVGAHPNTDAQTHYLGVDFSELSVAAMGVSPFTYQWCSNTTASNQGGVAISGATNSSYTPSGAVFGTSYYYCIISNACGSVKSNVSGAHTTRYLYNCNLNQPNFTNGTLGTVTFRTATTWTVANRVWSDVVYASNCNKTTYDGGAGVSFNADCRANTVRATYGDLFSSCAVYRFQDQLCPAPWRVPTHDDFRALCLALGGTDAALNVTYTNTTVRNKLVATSGTVGQFWGATYGGEIDYVAWEIVGQGSRALYWTSVPAQSLRFSSSGSVTPLAENRTDRGFAVRCVK